MPPKKALKNAKPAELVTKSEVPHGSTPTPTKSGRGAKIPSASKGTEEKTLKDSNLLQVKLEHHSTDKKPQTKVPKYFTVAEDSGILAVYKKYKGKKDYSLNKVAEEAQTKLPERSKGVIQDRITHFFVGMTKTEEDKITKAAAKNPSFYVHYEQVLKGDKLVKAVKEISADLPGIDSLGPPPKSQASSRKSSVRKSHNPSRSVSQQRKESPAKLPKELKAKIEEEDEEADGRLGKRNLLQHQKKDHQENPEDTGMSRRLNGFLEKLKSEEKKDIEDNARMLAKFVQHFSCNFCVSHADIMKVIEQQKGDIDINKVRAHFVRPVN